MNSVNMHIASRYDHSSIYIIHNAHVITNSLNTGSYDYKFYLLYSLLCYDNHCRFVIELLLVRCSYQLIYVGIILRILSRSE